MAACEVFPARGGPSRRTLVVVSGSSGSAMSSSSPTSSPSAASPSGAASPSPPASLASASGVGEPPLPSSPSAAAAASAAAASSSALRRASSLASLSTRSSSFLCRSLSTRSGYMGSPAASGGFLSTPRSSKPSAWRSTSSSSMYCLSKSQLNTSMGYLHGLISRTHASLGPSAVGRIAPRSTAGASNLVESVCPEPLACSEKSLLLWSTLSGIFWL
mmetsp:Transcript_53049/g.168335  ORF Transcript_53049/g.168335 Transcript_53049/m.168335 type:complete len:217 (-) Transcript_53049:5319-5969(-)